MNLHKWADIDFRGTVEPLWYTSKDAEGNPWRKYANIYLPYGYNKDKPCSILYMMHGGGGNPDAWLDSSQIKNALDRAFFEKTAEPFIVVFPTFYNLNPSVYRKNGRPSETWENKQVQWFVKEELRSILIPAVEARYHTFADYEVSEDSLISSRDHRAFGGFSMGGATTWYCFLEHLDIISGFIPLSGDCWAVTPQGGRLAPEETSALLADAAKSHGMSAKDYRILVGTGTEDPAYGNLTPQLKAMSGYSELFPLSKTPGETSFVFTVKEGAVHAYDEVYHHFWNYIPWLF